ncbi:uncharacterized protein FOMMEDRAFT_120454 [Fomitiporia mediterranea MF3/22]|uniref:uncharacterized protein n=1 Tax=Fomitiporia mediterranea (strain MF3/22) TaxID=694068 RepID=UPI00044093D9|nr:uncharacterized protein FOMMEDRAFT_120454 [Fomitiporia mediterranea MF3/22]EJD05181.1 hypothetical protein FOMMEDRAFT_120454 [Fomitiporia mediterranea MF3/22]
MAYYCDPSSYASTLFCAPFVRRRPSPPPTTYYPRETYDQYVRALAEEQAARSALQDAIRREREARQRRAEEEAKAHIRERVRRQEEAQARARQRQRPQSFYGFPFGYPQHQFGFPDFGGYGNYEDEGEDGDEATTYPYSWYSYAPRREPVRRPQTQAPPKAPRSQSRSPVYNRQQSQSSAERRGASSPKVSIPITTPSSTHPEASPEEQNAAASKIQAAYRVHASLSSIKSARERFTSLLNAFTFPAELDFDLSSPPSGDERPKLAYTSRNAPVHAHEDALIKLLQTLDAVESHGDVHVREARRELVREIEKELGRIDAEVRRAWDEVQSKPEPEFALASAAVEETVIDVPIAPETIASSEPVFVDQKEASETMHIDTEAQAPTPSTIDEPTSPIDAKMDDMPTELSSVSNSIDTETVTTSSQPEAPLESMDVEPELKSQTEPEGETGSEPYILSEDDAREIEDITTALEPPIEEDSSINPNPENANSVESPVDSESEVIRTPPTPHVSLPLSQPTIRSEAVVPALTVRSSGLQEPSPEPKPPSVVHQTTVEDVTDEKDEDEFVVL